MSVTSRIALSAPTTARQYLARLCSSKNKNIVIARSLPIAMSLILRQQQRSFSSHQPSLQATHSNNLSPVHPPTTNNNNANALASTQFDPPCQISRILTHYCREPQMVMIEGYGILQGEMDESRLLSKYLNVPFAKVQDQFQQAVAPEPWKGIRDATLYGPMCPQNIQETNTLSTMMLGLPGPGFEYSERDCLNLNVFAPRCVQDVPVICYIHGGLSQGGIALPKHDATNIVKMSVAKDRPVIVVTINYRLLPSAGLLRGPPKHGDKNHKDEEDDDAAFNWGLYDQKIALEWVRKHIHNFGGNPNEITLMGHSSGESSAGYHMLTTTTAATSTKQDEKNGRLFKRAIMHSGAAAASTRSATNDVQGEEVALQLSSLLGDMAPIGSSESSASLLAVRSVSGQDQNKDHQGQSSTAAAAFTFMSDACLPHMNEMDKQAGWRVIDRWIDFAWGQEGDSVSASDSSVCS
ncbi:MAG: Carboxylesterase family-domain-containing protein [Linnemannia gamsii]|nr:MAG: Carboxylesterase family-domain-containing protein [Linnemannia gamsii]